MAWEIGAPLTKGKGRAVAALRGLTALIYPPRCIACPAETDMANGLCADCWREIEFISGPVCATCCTPVDGAVPGQRLSCDACTWQPPPWNEGKAAVIYGGAGRRVILQLKHGDRLDIVPALAGWMARAGADLIARADLIAPVPLHWSRHVTRRYNQSAELVRRLSPPGKSAPDLLVRKRATASLDGKSRDARATELNGAIGLGSSADVHGKTVLLVDDVLTTGATLAACTRELTEHGAAEVNVLTLARVVMDRAT